MKFLALVCLAAMVLEVAPTPCGGGSGGYGGNPNGNGRATVIYVQPAPQTAAQPAAAQATQPPMGAGRRKRNVNPPHPHPEVPKEQNDMKFGADGSKIKIAASRSSEKKAAVSSSFGRSGHDSSVLAVDLKTAGKKSASKLGGAQGLLGLAHAQSSHKNSAQISSAHDAHYEAHGKTNVQSQTKSKNSHVALIHGEGQKMTAAANSAKSLQDAAAVKAGNIHLNSEHAKFNGKSAHSKSEASKGSSAASHSADSGLKYLAHGDQASGVVSGVKAMGAGASHGAAAKHEANSHSSSHQASSHGSAIGQSSAQTAKSGAKSSEKSLALGNGHRTNLEHGVAVKSEAEAHGLRNHGTNADFHTSALSQSAKGAHQMGKSTVELSKSSGKLASDSIEKQAGMGAQYLKAGTQAAASTGQHMQHAAANTGQHVQHAAANAGQHMQHGKEVLKSKAYSVAEAAKQKLKNPANAGGEIKISVKKE